MKEVPGQGRHARETELAGGALVGHLWNFFCGEDVCAAGNIIGPALFPASKRILHQFFCCDKACIILLYTPARTKFDHRPRTPLLYGGFAGQASSILTCCGATNLLQRQSSGAACAGLTHTRDSLGLRKTQIGGGKNLGSFIGTSLHDSAWGKNKVRGKLLGRVVERNCARELGKNWGKFWGKILKIGV